eukprot:1523395-Prymnesium_polylepis.1
MLRRLKDFIAVQCGVKSKAHSKLDVSDSSATWGLMGAGIPFAKRAVQSNDENHLCFLTSSGPACDTWHGTRGN